MLSASWSNRKIGELEGYAGPRRQILGTGCFLGVLLGGVRGETFFSSRKEVYMRRHNLTSASLTISLACMALLGNLGVGVDPLQARSSPEAENSQIAEGSKVTFQYVTIVPGSAGLNSDTAVSEFIQGRHDIFPALEHEVVGMKTGEEKQVELSPEESFGPHDEGKTLFISKTLLPPGAKQGDIVKNDVGELATVVAVGDMAAVLDYNHPLAGKPIVVQVKILKVENP